MSKIWFFWVIEKILLILFTAKLTSVRGIRTLAMLPENFHFSPKTNAKSSFPQINTGNNKMIPSIIQRKKDILKSLSLFRVSLNF